MHIPSTEEQEQRIEELEILLDEKEADIDSLRSEILELESTVTQLESSKRMMNANERAEIINFKATLLENLERMQGLVKEDYLRRSISLHHELFRMLSGDDEVVRAVSGRRYSQNSASGMILKSLKGGPAISLGY